MPVFTSTDFTGHWPVGSALVVRAASHDEAVVVAQRLCKDHGLKFDGTLKQMAENSDGIMLCDGVY
jgi:hypothetical protein